MTDRSCNLVVRFLGRIEIQVDGNDVRPRTRDALHLLALLAACHGAEQTRESVAERLWPGAEPRAGSHNLRRALWDLRRTLGCADERIVVAIPSRHLRLDVRRSDVDIVRFDELAESTEVELLQEAVALYAGPFLPDVTDAWAVAERQKRQEAVVKALDTLATEAADGGRADEAMAYRRQAAQIAPLDRPASPGAAPTPESADIQAYRSFQRSLTEAPPETPSDAHESPQRDPDDLLEAPAPAPRPRPLPLAPARLVGRDVDVRRALGALSDRRLLTLTGPGGVGKSRLALAIAAACSEATENGAGFVDLSPIVDPDLIPSTAAYRLGLPVDPSCTPLEVIQRAVGTSDLLIVLDNCDGVREAAAAFTDSLLASCPNVRIVTSCRKLLQSRSEAVQAVAPLMVPGIAASETGESPAAAVLSAPASALFVELSGTGAVLRDADSIAAICRRLGGMPLAIALAASASTAVAPADLASVLEQGVVAQVRGFAGAGRDQIVSSMVEWAYGRLTGEEKDAARAATVFAGGWTTEAMGALLGNPARAASVLAAIERAGLIRRVAADRYDMLDPVRTVLLAAVPTAERDRLREAHHAYYRALSLLVGVDFEVFQTEIDNLRAAIAWSLEEPARSRSAVALCAVFATVAFERDVYEEVGANLAALLERPDLQARTPERSHALAMLGYFALRQGDVATAQARLRESVAVMERARDQSQLRNELRVLGEAEELAGDLTAARLALEKSVSLARAAKDTACLAHSLRMLGTVWERVGNLDVAQTHLEEALSLWEPSGVNDWPFVLCNLGSVALRRGEVADARTLGRQMLAARRDADNVAHIQDGLDLMARIAVNEGQYYRAGRLYGATMRVVQSVGATRYWSRRLDFVARLRAVQHILGDTTYAKAYNEGQRMTWQDAVAFALDERPGGGQ